MGVPTAIAGLSVNALPFRAYAKIIDEWFRDQNLQQPLNMPVTDATVVGVNTDTFVSDIAKGGKPFVASKYRDYFTSCLPAPQKGPDISIGLSGLLPVYGNTYALGLDDGTLTGHLARSAGAIAVHSSDNALKGTYSGSALPAGGSNMGIVTKASGKQSGLEVDLGSATAISINALRTAFAIQKLYEKDARGGTRYIEIIKAHFGVTSPDSRQQRPEYLGALS